MAVACASRFSCLKVEDLEVEQPENKDAINDKNKTSKGAVPTKPTQTAKSKKKKKNALEAAELQSLVFGTNSHKPKTANQTLGTQPKSTACNQNAGPQPKVANQNAGSQQKKKGKNQSTATQCQEWKAKDDKFVTDAFEQDLQEALLMSKIDFEEKKTVLDVVRRDSESEAQDAKKKKKNLHKKEKTMSLDAFQNLLPSQIDDVCSNNPPRASPPEPSTQEKKVETDFFESIEADAEKIVAKEHRMEEFKSRQPFVAEQARSLQYRDELECKDRVIEELRAQVRQLEEDLKGAKYRNKKLCLILSHGEIRDKAEILVQVEQLTEVRDELTQEVQQLVAALEQERSKVHSLQMELKKQGQKKESKDGK